MARRKRLARSVGVVEHLVGAVAAAQPLQEVEARVVAAQPAQRSVGPMLRVADSPSQGVQPRGGDAEIRMVLGVVLWVVVGLSSLALIRAGAAAAPTHVAVQAAR